MAIDLVVNHSRIGICNSPFLGESGRCGRVRHIRSDHQDLRLGLRDGGLARLVDETGFTKGGAHRAGTRGLGVGAVDGARTAATVAPTALPTAVATALRLTPRTVSGIGVGLEVVVGQSVRSEAALEAQLLLVLHALTLVAPLLRLPVEAVGVRQDPGLAVVVGLDDGEHPPSLVHDRLGDRDLLTELVLPLVRRRAKRHRDDDLGLAPLARDQERVEEGALVVVDLHRAVAVVAAEVPEVLVAQNLEERHDATVGQDPDPVVLRLLERAAFGRELETRRDAADLRMHLRLVLPVKERALVVGHDPGLRLPLAEGIPQVAVLDVRPAVSADIDAEREVRAGVGVLEDHRTHGRALATQQERHAHGVDGESTLPAVSETRHDVRRVAHPDRLEDDARVGGRGLLLRLLTHENLLSVVNGPLTQGVSNPGLTTCDGLRMLTTTG